jgi:hypothetical protein
MSVKDRANDNRRVPNVSGGSYEDTLAQTHFAAHGYNKGKAGEMAAAGSGNVEKSFAATSWKNRSERLHHKDLLSERANITPSQIKQEP